jgi:hypothetical protein
LYQGKNSWQCARAASIEPNRAGNAGRYFRVLNWASEYGLSSDVRAGVGLGDAEVGEQQRDRLGRHRGAAVGVQAELAAGDALLGAGLADELLGQDRGLAGDRAGGRPQRRGS